MEVDRAGDGARYEQPTLPADVLEVQHYERHVGPLPSASALGSYEEVLPGLADRIVTMAERDAAAKRRSMVMLAKSEARAAVWGTVAATGISLIALVGAIWLLVIGITAGAWLITMPVAIMVKSIAGSVQLPGRNANPED